MLRKKIATIGLLICILLLITGCSDNQTQTDAKAMFAENIEKLAEVESYTVVMRVKQDYDGLGTIESEITVYENINENAFYYIASMEGENAVEIYQLDDTFTIRFNVMGFVHTETFTGDDFAQTSSDIYLMESFQDLSIFSNFSITETRQHYVITGDTLINNLITNELFPFDENGIELESGEITIYISKNTQYIERMTLDTVMIVDGARLVSSSEAIITEINNTNNIKSLIYN